MAEDFGGDHNASGNKGERFVKDLMAQNVSIPPDVLSKVFNVPLEEIEKIEKDLRNAKMVKGNPLTWDYVLAFRTGEQDKMIKPKNKEKANRPLNSGYESEWENGMTERKYFLQIILQTQRELEGAFLSTRLFKFRKKEKNFTSEDEKFIFMLVGMTEDNIKRWADHRDTDLEIEPVAACREGRRREFPLALRTRLDEQDDPAKCTLPLENWHAMYCQYNPRAEKSIYRQYPRLPDDSNSPKTFFDEKTRLRIIYETMIEDKGEGGAEIEIQAHITSAKHPLVACFPLHDSKQLDSLEEKWIKNREIRNCMTVPLEEIKNYFGEPTAFYYGFMMFYLRWLIWPTIIGVIFFIAQLGYGQVDVPGLFVMALFIIFWCVAFVDFWIRQESRYRLLWGMTKFETKAVARPEFKGEWQHDRVSGLWIEDYSFIYRLIKGSFVFSGLGVWMAGCVVSAIYVLLLRDANPEDLGLKIGLGITNGAMISFFDYVYQFVSIYGNKWENHRTEQDFQDALISKSFIFKFFNSFSSLFYLTFIRPYVKGTAYYVQHYSTICGECKDSDTNIPSCSTTELDYSCCYSSGSFCTKTHVENQINSQVLSDLRLQLASLFVTAIVIQNFLEVFIPFFKGKLAAKRDERNAQQRGEALKDKSEAERQMSLAENRNTIDDMSEMVVQFGYITMFVIALPITPLLALINNIIELRVDGYKIIRESQRPHPNGSYGLGAWNGVLGFFSIVAVGTNVALITWRTRLVPVLLNNTDPTFKWVFFTFISILLGLLVAAEKWAIPDTPIEVTQGIERQRLIENILVLGARIDKDDDEPPKKDGEEVSEFAFDPTKDFIDVTQLPQVPLGDLTQLEEKPSGP
ncbi:hypothetical protein RFI_11648 [Reticulomyxa filosa]|uniref:Anoctamin transmembrane domain-containing protein n=1 Tax=Reticulomyxa filosa TaxID=46433 RepID=X6NJG0_RETFI|nr:hypothetical protein RFI_11648 [Reticulomyxa filosa]|eukprot:ETO25487.1 hypothetical protein RFI_11648 [Reticulomyxa filosa]